REIPGGPRGREGGNGKCVSWEPLAARAWGFGFAGAFRDDPEAEEAKEPIGDIEAEVGSAAGEEFIQERLVNLGGLGDPVGAQAVLRGGLADMVRQAHRVVVSWSHGGPGVNR